MWRPWAVFIVIILLYIGIFLRLFQWQVLEASTLKEAAADQHYFEFTIPAARGAIASIDGSPLVINQPAYLVYAEPGRIENKPAFVDELSKILPIDKPQVLTDITTPGRLWVPLSHRTDVGSVDLIKALNIEGIGFEKEPKRYYPEASMAAHLLGFVGSDELGRNKGYFGLEGYYDRELRGKDGVLRIEKGANGAPILIGETKRIDPEDGRSLVLWLDRTVQMHVEKALLAGISKYGAKEGSIVVMDPTSGGVIAMASYPNYDPGTYGEFDKSLYKNPVVGSSYEPGSTFKAIVMSMGLEEKAITPTTIVDEEGSVQIGPYTIRTWNNEYHGPITMTQVLQYSSNVGMVHVAQKLGLEKMIGYVRDFGFGQSTGVDLQDENVSDIRESKEWKDVDLATASFGQGIAVTPLSMVRAVSVIANSGWLMEPHIVKEIRDESGKTTVIKPKRIRRPIGASAAKLASEMMVAAVESGEAKWAKPKGYRVAGKTGTAQIPVEGHYDEKKTIASFVGFAPADEPMFVMLVTLREPTSSPWGSETAAPLFFAIAADLFAYFKIPPTL